MSDDRDTLMRLAGAVADGERVDWEQEAEENAGLEDRLERLRLLEEIGTAHRSEETITTGGEGETSVASGKGGSCEASGAVTRDEAGAVPAPSRGSIRSWGSLEILELIGRGGFGEVYRARDPALDKEVALKLPRPGRGDESGDKRFLHEARRLARVRHPNVLVVHGADRHDGRVGLWTDLVEGQTLEDCLTQQGVFGSDEATVIGGDLCRALAAVHAAGLVHRDVKTANIMREQGGRIVLMDFSSVSENHPEDESDGRPSLSGTPRFMAPELFAGSQAGPASDIYSLGVVLYRLVSGRYPVDAASFKELVERHRRGERLALRDARADLPAGFVQVIERALSAAPEDRFQSAGDMERALRDLMGARPGPAPPPPPLWKQPALVAIASAVAVAVLGWVFLFSSWFASLTVEADLYRVVEGAEERLLPGAEVQPGDRLFLEVESSKPMYIYVLNEDAQGASFVLFPLEGLALANPLPAGTGHRLPGEMNGEENYWRVSSGGGQETVMVIASERQLSQMEMELENLPRAGAVGERDPSLTRDVAGIVVRGIPGLARAEPSAEEAPLPLSRVFQQFTENTAGRDGIWLWQIQLRNPGS